MTRSLTVSYKSFSLRPKKCWTEGTENPSFLERSPRQVSVFWDVEVRVLPPVSTLGGDQVNSLCPCLFGIAAIGRFSLVSR